MKPDVEGETQVHHSHAQLQEQGLPLTLTLMCFLFPLICPGVCWFDNHLVARVISKYHQGFPAQGRVVTLSASGSYLFRASVSHICLLHLRLRQWWRLSSLSLWSFHLSVLNPPTTVSPSQLFACLPSICYDAQCARIPCSSLSPQDPLPFPANVCFSVHHGMRVAWTTMLPLGGLNWLPRLEATKMWGQKPLVRKF